MLTITTEDGERMTDLESLIVGALSSRGCLSVAEIGTHLSKAGFYDGLALQDAIEGLVAGGTLEEIPAVVERDPASSRHFTPKRYFLRHSK